MSALLPVPDYHPSPPAPSGWPERAACRGADPDLFYPPEGERGGNLALRELVAKRICATCPVLDECAHALLTDRGRVLGSALVDVQTVEYTLEEQIALWSRTFLTLPTFEFLVGASAREGTLPTELVRLTIRNLDRGVFVNEALTRTVRARLMGRDGVAVAELLAEIAARTRQSPVVAARDDQAPRLLCAGAAPPAAPQELTGFPDDVPITRHHPGEE